MKLALSLGCLYLTKKASYLSVLIWIKPTMMRLLNMKIWVYLFLLVGEQGLGLEGRAFGLFLKCNV